MTAMKGRAMQHAVLKKSSGFQVADGSIYFPKLVLDMTTLALEDCNPQFNYKPPNN